SRTPRAHSVPEPTLPVSPNQTPPYRRFFTPARNTLPTDSHMIGEVYIRALYDEVVKWLMHRATDGPIGVCFSGGIDSGSVLLIAYHAMLKLGMNPARLKAFTLSVDGGGEDLAQARRVLEAVGLT